MKTLNLIVGFILITFVMLDIASSTPEFHFGTDGRQYIIETEHKYNWLQAYHECASRDFQLLTIDSAAKNVFIINLLEKVLGKPYDLWLGGNDEFSLSRDFSRPFIWLANGKKFNFSNWSFNNPDNSNANEHCVHIWSHVSNYQWNDNNCDRKLGFICEINHYVESCQEDLKNKCNVLQKSSLSILEEFDQSKKDFLTEINNVLQNITNLGNALKIETLKLQNSTKLSVQKTFHDQLTNVQRITEKILKVVSDRKVEIQETSKDIKSRFGEDININPRYGEKINGSSPIFINFKNLFVFKQKV